MAELDPGTVLGGRFVVHGVLGRGGTATVYLAEDRQSGGRVALKLVHAHLAADPAARRRLDREVAAAGRLDHPGVLVARELVDVDGQVGLVLPLHAGRTLAEQLALEGPMPAEQVRRLGLRLAEALGAAHLAGVLHRDVTARNVLVDDRGAPVLTDFGLARLADQRTGRSTALLGTAGFVAPEVLGGGRAEPRSDLYGLGAVLYQAATGNEPFAADHPSATLQRQLGGEVASIREQVPGFPPWLDALIRGLLEPDPDRRPAGAAAVVAALEEGRAPEVPTPAVEGPPVSAKLPAGTWSVVVRDRQDGRGVRRAQRHLRRRARRHGRGGGDLGRLLDTAAAVIGEVAGPSDEERLTASVAQLAGLPGDALEAAAAMDLRAYRIVAGVDQDTAETVANEVRLAGLRADVVDERSGGSTAGWLLAKWWVAIPVMWVLFPALMTAGAPPWTVFAFVIATVLLATLVAPVAAKARIPAMARSLPVAYRPDLREHLAEGWAERVALVPAEVPPKPLTRAGTLAAQAHGALELLDEAIRGQEGDLADVVRRDLSDSLADLRAEVVALSEQTLRLEASLAESAPRPDGGWAGERLARLDTLARSGAEVDGQERTRLVAAVKAHEAAVAAEQALESRLTADLARLLEISATARRLGRELDLEQGEARSDARAPERALDDLKHRAAAAARARKELG